MVDAVLAVGCSVDPAEALGHAVAISAHFRPNLMYADFLLPKRMYALKLRNF
jgi:hypothetical protein